jgi:late competence protein required for DNA uptake (superfamily II DNA/RNA helicase)
MSVDKETQTRFYAPKYKCDECTEKNIKPTMKLSCGHSLCESCYLHFAQNNEARCPMCRVKLLSVTVTFSLNEFNEKLKTL